jgi:hypothetical protein
VTISAGYDGDNYAFGVAAGFRQKFATASLASPMDGNKEWYLDDAWGKYYLMENKQLWLRAGALTRAWGLDTDPLGRNYGGDNGPGLQINFAPSAVSGLNIGVAMPVPLAGTRVFKVEDVEQKLNWAPTYPFANMVFGLRLNGTIPNLDFGTELKLKGLAATNGKTGDDEGEGDFTGMNFHLTAIYTFAPVTIKAALVAEGIADGRTGAADPVSTAGVRVIFDIPNSVPNLDLGDPWVQLQMLPNANPNSDKKTGVDSFADMLIEFEWAPSYSIVPDKAKAILTLSGNYRSWADAGPAQEDYPLEFAVQPQVVFTFAPNATLAILDKITLVQKEKEKGFANLLGFRFALAF